MASPKVSVIVPVFNVKTYLRECLDSILNQTLPEIEILCGDGGSTDGSLEILQEYAQKDPRVRYITEKGSGYGQSVNDCMDLAQGEYIGIVESDDAIKPNTYEVLYGLAKKNALDWIRGDIFFYYSSEPKGKQLKRESIIYDHDFYNVVLNPQTDYRPYKSGLRTWSGIYKTEFLRANGIKHNETPGGSYQDVGFYLKTLYFATRVYFVNQAFYMWRQDNPSSSVHYNSAKLVEKSLHEWALNREYLDQHPNIGKMAMASYHYRKFFSYLWTIDMAVGDDKRHVKEIAYQEFSQAITNNEIDKGFFEDWEWIRFQETLQSWKAEIEQNEETATTEDSKIHFSGKKLLKKLLRPFADFMRKIVYKLMRNVLFSLENDIKYAILKESGETKDKLVEMGLSLHDSIVQFHDQEQIIHRLLDMALVQTQKIQELQDCVVEINKKTQEESDLLWVIKSRAEDIHDKVAVINTKVLDQGDIIWETRDKAKDIELLSKKNAEAQAWNWLYERDPKKMAETIAYAPLYDSAFYINNRYGSVLSAQHILSVIFRNYSHNSVVDFGCGTGTWLWVAKALGAKIVCGLDGAYVPKSMLMIEESEFQAVNLEQPVVLNRTYDMAISMEVAEHLSKNAAENFVDSLCRSADLILFSAAHPGQGGDGHINEQPAEYWIDKFEARNFAAKEIRPWFEKDEKIEWWYRQNLLLFHRKK